MLSQTGGTVGAITDLGNYTDAKHYRLPEPAGARVVLQPADVRRRRQPSSAGVHVVPPFQRHVPSSARRDRGRARPRRTDARPRARRGSSKSWRFSAAPIARRCSRRWPRGSASTTRRLPFAAPPSGWCSWYCFGPKVTAKQVLDNLDVIARDIPGLRYIQIDDGYQPAMGDWLETGSGVWRRRANRAAADPRSRLRAGDLGRAVHRRSRLATVQGASRLVRQGRRPASRCVPIE